nr:FAD-dependent oxidoreductase [Actinomadura rugatobispora]
MGSGAAGLAAALTTARAGLGTIVLERTGLLGGTSAMSGGLVYAPGSRPAREAGHVPDPGAVTGYLEAVARRPIDKARLEAFLEAAPAMVDELAGAGVAFRLTGLVDYYRDAPGAGPGHVLGTHPFDPSGLGGLAARVRRSPYRGPEELWTAGTGLVGHLVAACARAGVRFRTSCRARKLLVEDGRVAGVLTGGCAESVAVRAPDVVLASGGFEFDDGLLREWVGAPLEGSWSCPGNEGDGLAMARTAGAGLSGMGEVQWYALLRLSDEEREGAPLMHDASPARNLPGSIIVDRNGRRFANEGTLYQDFGRAVADPDAARLPAWLVVDAGFLDRYRERCFGDRPLTPPHWLSAGTISELAGLIGADAAVLTETVERFNAGAARGLDPDFGRGEAAVDREWGDGDREGARACLAPLERGPFHATRVYAGSSGTTGGPSVDPDARVLDGAGAPIPGLYAAGNITAGVFGDSSPASGATLGPGMTFGHLAGRAIAAGRRDAHTDHKEA